MIATYRNPWHTPGKPQYGPSHYETDAEPMEYRGHSIYRRLSVCWDVVRDGVCIGQYAGATGAQGLVDLIHDKPGDYWAQRAERHYKEGRAAMTLEEFGYRIRTYDGFMTGCVEMNAGAREEQDRIREALRERAADFEGSHVVYDPNDDEDGWLLVGEESEIRAETEKTLREHEA